MNIEQIDNRRVRRARKAFVESIDKGADWNTIRQLSIKFSWHLDLQSARIARRVGWDSFAGVPCHFGS